MRIDRRSFLVAASLAAAPLPAYARDLSRGAFTHGVASGDPLPHRVIIWTRFESTSGGRVAWEVAEDEAFSRIAARGQVVARPENDYCVKADVNGLSPGRPYFYRFLSSSGPSPTGKTRTTPIGAVDRLTVALVSCGAFEAGYFYAYGHAAHRDDVDLVLHVGDYIYEYPAGGRTGNFRPIQPAGELVTLSDYYQRYACYTSDADLLELRRLKPWAVLWDDHELISDTWRTGAVGHDEATEGSFADRIAAATKAFFDWMPIRHPERRDYRIYRSIDWGNLARIVLLDARYIGRDRQVESWRGAATPEFTEALRRALRDPGRSMLGPRQEAWLTETLAESRRRGQPWQVITQQVVVGDQFAPKGITSLFDDSLNRPDMRSRLSNAEQLSSIGLPLKPDGWAGYPVARARFLETCAANAANALVLSGDSHNCWFNNLRGDGRLAAVEFAGGSVSAVGWEQQLNKAAPGQRETMFRSANPDIVRCDVTNRGYGAITLTADVCTADWVWFDDIRSPTPSPSRVMRLRTEPNVAAGIGAWIPD